MPFLCTTPLFPQSHTILCAPTPRKTVLLLPASSGRPEDSASQLFQYLQFIRSDSCVDASASIPDISPFASKSDTGCPSMLRMLFRLTTKSVHKFPGLRYIKPNGLIIYLHHHFLHGSSFRCRNMALAVCLYLRHSSE